MDFSLPKELTQWLAELDTFINDKVTPLQHSNDNNRFFDHRREHARTNWEKDGIPREEWEDLLGECVRLADDAGFWRAALPKSFGGQEVGNLWMAVTRDHLASKGLGLFNDLQNEHSVVGNFPDVLMLTTFGNPSQQALVKARLERKAGICFGLTEPDHGSDATHMDTIAVKEVRGRTKGWRIKGRKMWQTGMHKATHSIVFARTDGKDGDAKGITALIVPTDAQGVVVESYEWTFNMPTDHATVSLDDVFVTEDAVLGEVGSGLSVAQAFVHENRIRQAASSLGAASYCINEAVVWARKRKPFGEPLSKNQAIQFPLVELATQAEMLRLLIRKTAWEMDRMPKKEIEKHLSDKVAMCNYWANRLCTQAADRAIQVHGGWGYSRHMPFEHIYRHHRRYRITEGSEEIQMRKIAAHLFGYIGPKKELFSKL